MTKTITYELTRDGWRWRATRRYRCAGSRECGAACLGRFFFRKNALTACAADRHYTMLIAHSIGGSARIVLPIA